MSETVVVTEEGCDNSWTYRRCEEDDEQFELLCEDGSTRGTRSHFEDVLLDNIARRDDAIATLSAGFVAHDCRDGKLVAIPWALCSACVSVTECRQYTARQLCNTLATLRAQLAGVREGVGKIIAHTGRLPNASPDLLNGLLDSVERNAREVLAALDGPVDDLPACIDVHIEEGMGEYEDGDEFWCESLDAAIDQARGA